MWLIIYGDSLLQVYTNFITIRCSLGDPTRSESTTRFDVYQGYSTDESLDRVVDTKISNSVNGDSKNDETLE